MNRREVAFNILAAIDRRVGSNASPDLIVTQEAPKDAAVTIRTVDGGVGSHESMDLAFLTGQVVLWMARLKSAYDRKIQESNEMNTMLLKKAEEQRLLIQKYETLRRDEEVQKQKIVDKYAREMTLMNIILEDYRKAVKEAHKSFGQYRERYQLPEESLYMPHPSGGGQLILVADWKKMVQKSQEDAIQATMNNFAEECLGKLQGHRKQLDNHIDRLEDLESAFSTLKYNVSGP